MNDLSTHAPMRDAARRCVGAFLAAVAASLAGAAWAAGGAHVVEDSEPEDAGLCHVDAWVSRSSRHDGLATLSPACTPAALPDLEVGVGVQRTWGDGQGTVASPAFKYRLLKLDDGVGLGLVGNVGIDTAKGRADDAALIVPLSFRLNDALDLNLNGGWTYARDDDRHDRAFVGAQLNYALGEHWALMGEVFRSDGQGTGKQVGVRWTPAGDALAFDLLYGRRLDGDTPRTVTLGVTTRF